MEAFQEVERLLIRSLEGYHHLAKKKNESTGTLQLPDDDHDDAIKSLLATT